MIPAIRPPSTRSPIPNWPQPPTRWATAGWRRACGNGARTACAGRTGRGGTGAGAPPGLRSLGCGAACALLVRFLFKGLFGYGHAPARALVWVGLILAGAWALYGAAYTAGQMAPNSDVVLTSQAWQALR